MKPQPTFSAPAKANLEGASGASVQSSFAPSSRLIPRLSLQRQSVHAASSSPLLCAASPYRPATCNYGGRRSTPVRAWCSIRDRPGSPQKTSATNRASSRIVWLCFCREKQTKAVWFQVLARVVTIFVHADRPWRPTRRRSRFHSCRKPSTTNSSLLP